MDLQEALDMEGLSEMVPRSGMHGLAYDYFIDAEAVLLDNYYGWLRGIYLGMFDGENGSTLKRDHKSTTQNGITHTNHLCLIDLGLICLHTRIYTMKRSWYAMRCDQEECASVNKPFFHPGQYS